MSSILPGTSEFDAPVYGTVFGQRTEVLHRLRPGDQLILVPDPPGTDDPSVSIEQDSVSIINSERISCKLTVLPGNVE